MSDEDETKAARARVVELASRVISGELSILVVARELAELRSSAGVDEHDPDFTTFIAIDSETDHLPIGRARELWAPDALAEKDQTIASSEKWARDFGIAACESLLARFRIA